MRGAIMEDYKVGNIVKGEVTGIEPYGVFIKIEEDIDGLIHISEIANKFVSNIKKYVNIGDKIYAKIIDIDSSERRLKLSIKGLNYKEFYYNRKVNESVRGFSPLQENLELWIKETLEEMEHQK